MPDAALAFLIFIDVDIPLHAGDGEVEMFQLGHDVLYGSAMGAGW